MTNEEAIEYWEQFNAEIDDLYNVCSDADRDVLVKQREIVEYTISAIRQQETVTNRNEPLTLEELRDMPCEPVYIVVGCASWWDIVSYAGMEYLYLKVEGSLPFRDYGKNWTAYRQKPEEDGHDERKENEHV